ncbi:hypothetical protein [Streptomyces sp. PvR018]|uniref:hypothetical protein n=1 Tax=Streptomyces sp. PvR018 TaxID=3156442 RepID=UPI003392C7D0
MTARPLAVGDIIHGFAYGAFGRDHYHCVRIEAAGPDWIVARDPDEPHREPSFASGAQSLDLCAQARDEGHKTPWGEPTQPCPAAGKPHALQPPVDVILVGTNGEILAHGTATSINDDGTITMQSPPVDPGTLPRGMNWRDYID